MKSEIMKNFQDYLKYRNYARRTIESYSSCLDRFMKDFPDHPKNASNKFLIEYLSNIGTVALQKQMTGTLRILYRDVLKCPRKFKDIKYPHKPEYLPQVLSKEEVANVIRASSRNLKHKAILTVLYDSGIRISELLALKLSHIDSHRMQILVKAGKGAKDRYTILGNNTLDLLRLYFKSYRPKVFLFEGMNGEQYSASSVRQLLKRYCEKAGVKLITPHVLRHSFATHHIESGTPESKVQRLLGHKRITTTQIYNHVTVSNVKSLLDVA